MADNNEPMIKLEAGGKAPIISYNIPEPTSYSGRIYIELGFPVIYFKERSVKLEEPPLFREDIKKMDPNILRDKVKKGMESGFYDPQIFRNTKLDNVAIRAIEKPNPGVIVESNTPIEVEKTFLLLTPEIITTHLLNGEFLNIFCTMYGNYSYNFINEPEETHPRLFFVETYRLSSFLGNYGAGRIIKTFSLLPGEKTKIGVRTYKKTEKDAKSASSIFDSFTQESSKEFEESLAHEQTNKRGYKETFSYHAEAEAKCSWGFGSAKVSSGVKGGTSSTREECAKSASSASSKHAAKASAKRNVEINTSYEVKEEKGVETSIEREIQNINVSRTLNFVFRQMNQEFITLFHLVDVRVAYFNGLTESYQEIAIPELDGFLEELIIESKLEKVKRIIIDELKYIYDYEDKHHSFVDEMKLKDENDNVVYEYKRIKKDYISEYKDKSTETSIKVPGIILSANKHVLRTEGVIVEALLGQGDGLDQYSHGLQDETIKAKTLANELTQAQIKREELGQKIIKDKNEAAAKIYQMVFPPPKTKDDKGGSTDSQ